MTVPQAFDSLIAKLIVTGATRQQALERARRALAEFEIDGMPTVLPFHRAVVRDPDFTSEPFRVHTRWIETEFAGDIPPYQPEPSQSREAQAGGAAPERERITVEVAGKRLEVTLPAGLGGSAVLAGPAAAVRGPRRAGRRAAAGPGRGSAGDELVSPMQGTIVKIVAAEGDHVEAGDTIVVLEAMKMEQPLNAHKSGVVSGLTASVGDVVTAGSAICEIK